MKIEKVTLIEKYKIWVLLAIILIPILIYIPTNLLQLRYNNVDVVINIVDDRNDSSNANEIWISDIKINEEVVNLDEILLNNGWSIEKGFIFSSNSEETQELVFSIKQMEKMEITFQKHAWCGIVEITYGDGLNKIVDLYSENVINETIVLEGEKTSNTNNTMTFFSIKFLIFMFILVAIYLLFPKRYIKYQWIVLLVASYIFYLTAGLKMVLPLIISTVFTWLGALWIQEIADHYKLLVKQSTGEEKKKLKQIAVHKKRCIVALVVILNLGILIGFKYTNFFIENINVVSNQEFETINFLVPLGISFYTFQSLGYLIDVYRGKYKADRNLFKFALFVSYFPQIIQGPISRYDSLAKQLFEEHRFDYTRVKFGIQRMLWGYFKKMVIADRVAIVVNEVFGAFTGTNQSTTYVGFTVFISVLFYGIQIYADFSGGMDIVVGISQILGIDIIENFRRPFMAKSVAEFWQRWHITLGSWMKDYLFYPLALSKPFGNMAKALRKVCGNYVAKVLPTCLASFIVFFLVGVWHGADWKYVIYGIYQATFVSTATLLEPFYAKCRAMFKVNTECHSWKLFQTLRTILLVTIGRYLSRAESAKIAFDMMKATIQEFNPWVFFDGSLYELGLDQKNFQFMIITIIFLFVVDFVKERGINLRMEIAKLDIVLRWTIYFVGIFSIIVFGIYGLGYDAGNFIYQGF